MTAKILATVDTAEWASLAEVAVTVVGSHTIIALSGPEGSIAATDPTTLRFEKAAAAALHRQLGEALGVDHRGLLQRCRDVLALGRLVGFDRDALPYLIRDIEKVLVER